MVISIYFIEFLISGTSIYTGTSAPEEEGYLLTVSRDIPSKLNDCGRQYALTWCESPERVFVACAETPTEQVCHFAVILLRY